MHAWCICTHAHATTTLTGACRPLPSTQTPLHHTPHHSLLHGPPPPWGAHAAHPSSHALTQVRAPQHRMCVRLQLFDQLTQLSLDVFHHTALQASVLTLYPDSQIGWKACMSTVTTCCCNHPPAHSATQHQHTHYPTGPPSHPAASHTFHTRSHSPFTPCSHLLIPRPPAASPSSPAAPP